MKVPVTEFSISEKNQWLQKKYKSNKKQNWNKWLYTAKEIKSCRNLILNYNTFHAEDLFLKILVFIGSFFFIAFCTNINLYMNILKTLGKVETWKMSDLVQNSKFQNTAFQNSCFQNSGFKILSFKILIFKILVLKYQKSKNENNLINLIFFNLWFLTF